LCAARPRASRHRGVDGRGAPTPYYRDEQTTNWFRACWGASEQQLLLMETAIWQTIDALAQS